MALAQLAFGLPHLVQRGAQQGAGLRVEQGGCFGVVVGVAELGQHVLFLTKPAARRLRAVVVMVVRVQRGCAGWVVVIIVSLTGGLGCVLGMCVLDGRCRCIGGGHVGRGQVVGWRVAGGRLIGSGWPLGRAFALFAQELAIAQPQQALVHADGVRALEVGGRIQAGFVLQQRLGVDDDLALAAEIRGQGLLDAGLQPGGLGLLGRRPAQDDAGAAAFLRGGLAGVAHHQLGDQVIAGGHAQRLRLQCGHEAAPGGRATAGERAALGAEGDVLAAALGQGQAQFGAGSHGVVVAGLEAQRPGTVGRRPQHQALFGREHAHLRRAVGYHVEPVQAAVGRLAVDEDAVQRWALGQQLAAPVVAVWLPGQREHAAVVEP